MIYVNFHIRNDAYKNPEQVEENLQNAGYYADLHHKISYCVLSTNAPRQTVDRLVAQQIEIGKEAEHMADNNPDDGSWVGR
tara:strand:- start:23 stop:265 length:243 start_codon:yes stop_codon:yes gene_type:complete